MANPGSNSTPVRNVFNSSQSYHGVSLNSCLAKGPHAYINNLIGILLRRKEEHVAFVGDLKKMFNSIHLKLTLLKRSDENLRVLGVGWRPKDVIVFEVVLNFSQKRRGVRTGPNLMLTDLPQALPDILAKRIVLQQVIKIYDPLGLVSPFTLIGNIYLRETWTRNVGWDDKLTLELRAKWVKLF